MKRFFIALTAVMAFSIGCSAQIFYKIEGKNLKKPSYLFGTHHFAPDSILDSMPLVGEALRSSGCVVGELILDDDPMKMMAAMQSHMMAPADSTLSDVLPQERYAVLDSVFGSLTGGLSLKMFDAMKPSMAQTTLAALMAQKMEGGTGQLDTYFQRVARRDSISVAGLETPEFQAEVLFDIVPIRKQAESLVEMLDDPARSLDAVKRLNDAYLRRDGQALWELSREAEAETDDGYFEILLDRRNSAWLDKLPGLMDSQSLFIAVGALHLYGDVGLVEGLRRLGYTVTPVY